MTQKDAVFSAVLEVLSSNNISFEVSVTNATDVLTKELRAKINDMLVKQFADGSIDLSTEAKEKINDNSKLRAYVSGLVSNWIRKDGRLNGGKTVATSKAPSHKNDPQIKALRQLLKSQKDPIKQQEIQGFIDKRLAEIG